MSTLVSDNVLITLPDGIDENVVEVDTGSDGTDQVAVIAPVADLDFDLTGDTDFSGSTITKSEVSVKADQIVMKRFGQRIDKITKRAAMKLRAAEPARVKKFRASQQATQK